METAHGPRARVRLTIASLEMDALVTVTSLSQEEAGRASAASPAEGSVVLARASLAKGARRNVFVEADLQAGRDNHLFFLVSAVGKRSPERQVVHLLVSLDESRRPEVVGEYIQYQGAPAQQMEP